MRKHFICYTFSFILIFFSTTVFAGMDDFSGTWKNTDPNTGGITTLKIREDGPKLKVHAWGKCHPKDCDWGEKNAVAYGATASSNIQSSVRAIIVNFKTGFSKTILIIKKDGSNKLRAEVYTYFTDSSGRSNYAAEYKFGRVRMHAAVPGSGRSMRPVHAIKEDCVSFNPATAKVISAQGRWKIADGSHQMFDFGNKRKEADQALSFIKRYRMDQSCFVGRPNPTFQYMLVSGNPPQGSIRGEDCISFHPDSIEVKNVNGRWKIVEGSHWIFDFKENEAEARNAFNIIQKHGFTSSCFVGRPDPSFQYLRK